MITIPDISDYYNNYDILLLFFAIFFVDVVVLFLVRYFPDFFGKALNDWYTDFKFTAILSDVLIILLGFIIARYVYTTWIKPHYGWNPLLFLALLVGIQIVHDILFYLAIILPLAVLAPFYLWLGLPDLNGILQRIRSMLWLHTLNHIHSNVTQTGQWSRAHMDTYNMIRYSVLGSDTPSKVKDTIQKLEQHRAEGL